VRFSWAGWTIHVAFFNESGKHSSGGAGVDQERSRDLADRARRVGEELEQSDGAHDEVALGRAHSATCSSPPLSTARNARSVADTARASSIALASEASPSSSRLVEATASRASPRAPRRTGAAYAVGHRTVISPSTSSARPARISSAMRSSRFWSGRCFSSAVGGVALRVVRDASGLIRERRAQPLVRCRGGVGMDQGMRPWCRRRYGPVAWEFDASCASPGRWTKPPGRFLVVTPLPLART
jgi:hypothetical protein